MRYPVAERFKSTQGEGTYTGTPMAFIRLVGCSVGHQVCTACDTDFDKAYPHLGGGLYTPEELVQWAAPYPYICITGGEPLDRELRPLVEAAHEEGIAVQVETSGTVLYSGRRHGSLNWICVSPKPGYLPEMLAHASEIKVIYKGLGDTSEGWPTVEDASQWARMYPEKSVFLQPRNYKNLIDHHELQEVQDLVNQYPWLRLSVQMHKFLHVR